MHIVELHFEAEGDPIPPHNLEIAAYLIQGLEALVHILLDYILILSNVLYDFFSQPHKKSSEVAGCSFWSSCCYSDDVRACF